MDLGNQRQGQCLSSPQESRTQFPQPLSCPDEPCLPLSSKPYPSHPPRETALRAPSIPPPKVSLIFSLPWIQVIAPRPRPLSQAPRNVTNSLPSFTGPVTWEVFIALQPVSLSCVSAATPPGRLFPTRPPFSGLSPLTQPPTSQIPLTGQSGGWLGGARTFGNRGRLSARHSPPFLSTPETLGPEKGDCCFSVTSTCSLMILILITSNNVRSVYFQPLLLLLALLCRDGSQSGKGQLALLRWSALGDTSRVTTQNPAWFAGETGLKAGFEE